MEPPTIPFNFPTLTGGGQTGISTTTTTATISTTSCSGINPADTAQNGGRVVYTSNLIYGYSLSLLFYSLHYTLLYFTLLYFTLMAKESGEDERILRLP
ncbi:hypothetical protein TWF192_000704 [Orbilia oligospora]|uniref:Uncharacterized protein n=1 Tax=Orbilia oligospora TaxID=2813651 RepID=A0A6G1LWD6_ORBOL|nr:hypothetical protein TWF191_002313 [Orbilia oligospora]KAF3235568.1 hypothetical protein TWF192_000704 [Orbilia oligospora]